jgi:hypothetical protein
VVLLVYNKNNSIVYLLIMQCFTNVGKYVPPTHGKGCQLMYLGENIERGTKMIKNQLAYDRHQSNLTMTTARYTVN